MLAGSRRGSSVLAFFRGSGGRDRSPLRQQPTPPPGGGNIDTVRYTPHIDKDSLDEAGKTLHLPHVNTRGNPKVVIMELYLQTELKYAVSD